MDPYIFMHFMLTDDCNTLLAVRQPNNGSLEFVTTPITILQNNSDDSIQLLKTNQYDNHFLNQIKINNILFNNKQQSILTPIEIIDIDSNEYQINNSKDCYLKVIKNPLYKISQNKFEKIQDTLKEILPEKKQVSQKSEVSSIDISVSLKKNLSSQKQYVRKSFGRTKKNYKILNEKQSWFKCDVCGEEFKKQYLLQKHMLEHAQDKPHNCPKCPASFNIPTNFTLHMAIHNIGEPKCPACGRKYARIASLKSHMLVHEVDENLYCTECDDVFGTKVGWNVFLQVK